MTTPEEQAEILTHKIGPIPELKSRTVILAKTLAKLNENQAVEVIRIILRRGARKIPRYQLALKSLKDIPELVRHIGRRKMSGIYTLSRQRDYDDVARLFQEISPMRRADEHPEDVYIDRELQDVALGMKKTLGRLGNRDLVNRLLHDQDPTVIRQILDNPGLTEDQVVRIAAKRPTSDLVLREISRSAKWTTRYRVQRALIFNPYTPTDISVRFVPLLLRQDLVEIRRSNSLHVELRLAAAEILKGDAV